MVEEPGFSERVFRFFRADLPGVESRYSFEGQNVEAGDVLEYSLHDVPTKAWPRHSMPPDIEAEAKRQEGERQAARAREIEAWRARET